MLVNIITIIVIILSIYYLIKKDEYLTLKTYPNSFLNNNKSILLFTMYNTHDRNNITNNILNYYINDLKFPKERLFIVDSSNNGVDTNLINKENQVVFNQNRYLKQNLDSTQYELLSLNKFIENKYNIIKNYKYLIKITCKYKLPDLLNLNLSNVNSSLIIQRGVKTYNTEIIGFKIDHIKYIINLLNNESNILEIRLKNIINKNNLSYIKFIPLKNLAHYKRSNGDILNYL
jgi:hypothetical protein